MKSIFLCMVLGCINSLAMANSSFTEESYQHIRQHGRVHVECDDGLNYDYNSYWCEGSYLDPSDSAQFSTVKRKGLDQVTLLITNNEGTSKVSKRINPFTGKTWFSIPLWGPNGILALGANQIDYIVENRDGSPLEEGQFKVEVTQPPVRECRPVWVRSSNSFDCRMPSNACQQLNWPRMECQPR